MPIDGSTSNFPNGTDVFTELFDLPHNKVLDANRLTVLRGKASLTNDEEKEIELLNASLKEYMITPETWNKFQDALYAVEKFFYDEVDGHIDGKQAEWATYVLDFKYIGVWTSGLSYKFQNMVTDSIGDLYICKKDIKNSTEQPSKNTTVWQKISSQGKKGDTGLNAIYKGDWLTTTAYQLGDVVNFGRVGANAGIDYIALKANTGKAPNVSPTEWTIYQKLYVGTTRPTGVGAGLHFIQEV